MSYMVYIDLELYQLKINQIHILNIYSHFCDNIIHFFQYTLIFNFHFVQYIYPIYCVKIFNILLLGFDISHLILIITLFLIHNHFIKFYKHHNLISII